MRKLILILMFTAAVSLMISPAFAEENQERGWQDSQQGGQGMMMGGQGPGRGGNGPMKGMGMMGGMMQKETVVATSDGGVVVMAGPRLIKYDKDLTLVKEVELPKGKKPGPGSEQGGQGEQMPPQDGQPQ